MMDEGLFSKFFDRLQLELRKGSKCNEAAIERLVCYYVDLQRGCCGDAITFETLIDSEPLPPCLLGYDDIKKLIRAHISEHKEGVSDHELYFHFGATIPSRIIQLVMSHLLVEGELLLTEESKYKMK